MFESDIYMLSTVEFAKNCFLTTLAKPTLLDYA